MQKQFPPSIPLPEQVKEARVSRLKQMVSTARKGVLLRSTIIAAELLGFVFLNSSALLLDALSSLIDIGSSLFLIYSIKLAERPPDEKHPFGHGRFEPIAGLQLGIFLAVMGGGMLFQQLSVLTKPLPARELSPYAWLIPFGAVVLLEIAYQKIKAIAKKENSPALLADGVHYRIDGINSLFAMIALILAAFFPAYGVIIDHLGAIVIALMMIGIGVIAARNNVNQLLDRIPDKSYFEKVRDAAMSVNGVKATEKLLIQSYGPDAHVSIDIEVDPHLSVDEAHEIAQKVRAQIQIAWPAVRDAIVHVEPFYPNDHDNNAK